MVISGNKDEVWFDGDINCHVADFLSLDNILDH